MMTATRNNANWIQTFTGKRFFPLDPDPQDIDIRDISHALANVCRFNGHTKEFYSVAQHSVLVSQIVPKDDAMWGLLHDASEAYIADITRPVKPYLTNYATIERDLMEAICHRFGLPLVCPAIVKNADLIVLNTEKRDVMGPSPSAWSRDWEASPMDEVIIPWAPATACERFMQRFNEISHKNWSFN